MKIIGVTGPSGAGKGELCRLFSTKNVPYIDTDSLYHKLLTPPSQCLDELVLTFGEIILNENKTLNRKKLASIVFTDAAQLKVLNSITHKYILAKTRELLKSYIEKDYQFAVIDAPLLIESGFSNECDIIISVLANKNVRKSRIIERDKINIKEAEKRLSAQNSDKFYIDKSNYVIYNNGNLDDFSKDFYDIFKKIGD